MISYHEGRGLHAWMRCGRLQQFYEHPTVSLCTLRASPTSLLVDVSSGCITSVAGCNTHTHTQERQREGDREAVLDCCAEMISWRVCPWREQVVVRMRLSTAAPV